MTGQIHPLLFGGALMALFLGSVSAQECVQVTSVNYVPSSSKGVGSDFMFEIEGRTTVTANTVRAFRGWFYKLHALQFVRMLWTVQIKEFLECHLSRGRKSPDKQGRSKGNSSFFLFLGLRGPPASGPFVIVVSVFRSPFSLLLRKVNVAVIIDASGSVNTAELELEKEFAKNAVASFAARNLFGMCTLVQCAAVYVCIVDYVPYRVCMYVRDDGAFLVNPSRRGFLSFLSRVGYYTCKCRIIP